MRIPTLSLQPPARFVLMPVSATSSYWSSRFWLATHSSTVHLTAWLVVDMTGCGSGILRPSLSSSLEEYVPCL